MLDVFIIFMTIVVKSDSVCLFIILANSECGNDCLSKITSDEFFGYFRVTLVVRCIILFVVDIVLGHRLLKISVRLDCNSMKKVTEIFINGKNKMEFCSKEGAIDMTPRSFYLTIM